MDDSKWNVAFKCTWNDAGFKGICSQKAYDYNISKNRVWCRKSPCRKFKGLPTEKDHPCYESIIFTEWRFGAGWDHKTIKRPRAIRNAKVGKIALLTTLEPNKEEKERKIIGFLRIFKIDSGHEKETVIYGDPDKSLEIDANLNIRFWDYYKNPNEPNKISWASGLFRYVSDDTISKLLRNLRKLYSDNNSSEEIIRKIDENIRNYEKLPSEFPPPEIKLTIKGKICLNCGHSNLEKANFCNNCGKELGIECSKCRTVNPTGSSYCFACGTKLTGFSHSSPEAIKDKLLEFGRLQKHVSRSWKFTQNLDADKLVQQDPNAFLFGVILDQGIDAEKAWAAPYELKKRIGHLNPKKIAKLSEKEIERFFKQGLKLHRFWPTMARRIKNACILIMDKYAGNAKNLWADEPDSRVLYKRLTEFDGIGQKKASMTVNILFRDMGVKIKNKSGIDVSFDEMVRRVFLRTGLVEKDILKEVIEAAIKLHPEYPGELDNPSWMIGRRWCLPKNPNCHDCFLNEVCPKIGV